MKLSKAITVAVAALGLMSSIASATVVGYNKVVVPAGADFRFSVPFGTSTTLAELFPPSLEGISFIGTAALDAINTRVLSFDGSPDGIDKASSDSYIFGFGAWLDTNNAFANADATVLSAGSSYIIRNTGPNSVELTVFTSGVVEFNSAVVLPTVGIDNDIPISSGQPVPVTLGELGLTTSIFTPTTDPNNLQDAILVFDNSAVGVDKASLTSYIGFVIGSELRFLDTGNAFADVTDIVTIAPSEGFVIRKRAGNSGGTWNIDI